MDIGFFISRVRYMRTCQKEYFRARSQDMMRESIRVEREVDNLIKDYYNANQHYTT